MPDPLAPELRDLLALSLVPGLGPRLTAALVRHFGSAGAVRRATAAELRQVPQIGEKLSRDFSADREVEDLEAVIGYLGGQASVFGHSSGAALALEAAVRRLPVERLVAYEPPYIPEGSPRPPEDQVEQYERMVAEGRRGDAVEFFMARVVGMPPEFVEGAKGQPFWAATEAIAHTLAYDARIMGDYRVPVERAKAIATPTIVIAGGADFPFMRETAQQLADALPAGGVRFLDGQGHDVDPKALAPVLKEFFAG